jgi:hypothetical protein
MQRDPGGRRHAEPPLDPRAPQARLRARSHPETLLRDRAAVAAGGARPASLPLHAAATALASFGGDLPLPGGPRRATFLADGFVSLSLDGVGDVREADEIVGAVFANTLATKVRGTCTAEEPPIPTGAELEGIVHRVVKAVS